MNKNIIYRLIGILGIIFMVVSVFLPFTSYSGYTTSLFDMVKEDYYVPYIILVFSALALVTFIIDKKVELSYLSIGSSLTIAILYSIRYKDAFNYLSYGYYLLFISPIIIFISILLQTHYKIQKNNLKKITNVDTSNLSDSTNNQVNNNFEPNELAQSIMDQPVMRDLSNIDDNSIKNTNEENNTLSPQNPLNQFITPSSNMSNNFQVNQEAMNQNNLQGDSSNNAIPNQKNNDLDNQSDNSQSILSVMSQPMVGGSIASNNSNVANGVGVSLSEMTNLSSLNNQQNNIENQNSQQLESKMPNVQTPSEVVEPPVNPIPETPIVSEVVEPPVNPIPETPAPSEVVEPLVNPIPETPAPSEVVEPPVNPIPETPAPSEVVEPLVNPIPETPAPSEVVEPPVNPIPDIPIVSEVVEPPVNPIPETPAPSEVVEPSVNSDSVFNQNPIKFD